MTPPTKWTGNTAAIPARTGPGPNAQVAGCWLTIAANCGPADPGPGSLGTGQCRYCA
jgi:hypothetical protein